MIGGNAKGRSGTRGASLELPTIASGKNHYVALGKKMDIAVNTLRTSADVFQFELAQPRDDES